MTEERVVVITGGASGLGAALTAHFVGRGDHVTMNYRSQAKAGKLVAELNTPDRLLAVKADVAVRAEVIAMLDQTVERFGRLDVLINSAGINRDAPFLELTDEDWDSVVDAHLKGTFICAQEFVRRKPEGLGHIINLGAACALQGRKNGANFCSAKGGISALTKCLARELAPRIQVNCLIPSAVDTEEVRERYHLDKPEGRKRVLDGIPMARLGALDDVTYMVDCILGSRFTTGENFFVNGGEYMH
ncbi:MAG: SDR family oxidoreductase [Alphaproteobacteria bacterium]|nr:SDR family oxidoreductase [Alphaproteobacteria bacterium]